MTMQTISMPDPKGFQISVQPQDQKTIPGGQGTYDPSQEKIMQEQQQQQQQPMMQPQQQPQQQQVQPQAYAQPPLIVKTLPQPLQQQQQQPQQQYYQSAQFQPDAGPTHQMSYNQVQVQVKPQDVFPVPQNLPKQRQIIQLTPDDAVEYSSGVVPSSRDTDPSFSAQYHIGDTPPVEDQRRDHQSMWGVGLICLRGGTLNMAGPMVMPKYLNIWIFMHGGTYDLSLAHFVHPVSYIRCFITCGGVNLILPRGVRLEQRGGVGFCGDFSALDEYSRDANTLNVTTPTVRVSGLAICGGVSPQVNNSANPLVVVSHLSPSGTQTRYDSGRSSRRR
jgi:hypothetical protein